MWFLGFALKLTISHLALLAIFRGVTILAKDNLRPNGTLRPHLQARPPHGSLCRGASRGAAQAELLERRQNAVVERGGEGGAAGVGDLGVAEDEALELRQHSSRQRRRTCRRWRQKGGEALVAGLEY